MSDQSFWNRVESLLGMMDEKNEQIMKHLLRKRHAGIRELADLVSASSDMEVLIRIRKTINPKAQDILGEPILAFERCRIDPLTGERITFSWWLREAVVNSYFAGELLDIFDENRILRVVTVLPARERDVEAKVREDLLIISGKEYHKEIPLPCRVEKRAAKSIKSGVLEVRLRKLG